MNRKIHILVPYDFTPVSGYAVEHAIIIAKKLDAIIELVHIVKQKGDIFGAETILVNIANKSSTENDVKVRIVVRKGSIFRTINNIAKSRSSTLVVMGTHGMIGMQKVVGSKALRVITGSNIPYVVIQEPPTQENIFERLLSTIDNKSESKEKLRWISYLKETFDSELHFLTESNSEGDITDKKIKSNVSFTKRYLSQRGYKYKMDTLKEESFADGAVNFAVKHNITFILAMPSRDIGISDNVAGNFEQDLLFNHAKIPILIVNRANLMKIGYGGF